MVKFIQPADVLPIRSRVLRNGRLTPEECVFPGDYLSGSFHLGYFTGEQLLGIATFYQQGYQDMPGAGYQLRGMASVPEMQGKGVGTQLMRYAIDYLEHQRQADYLWCNARKKALSFYERLGFTILSDEFEVPEIGPHYLMHKTLKATHPVHII